MAFVSLLSIAQAAVVWGGLVTGMVVCVLGVAEGSLTVGDTVLFVTMMNQLYVPLTFFGSYYRQVLLIYILYLHSYISEYSTPGMLVCVLGVAEGNLTVGDTVLFVTIISFEVAAQINE
jgi:hypothetical protein